MAKQTISFTLDSARIARLDALAKTSGCNRSRLLEEAVTAYLEAQQWQVKQIKRAILQADRGQLVDHIQVKKMFAKGRGTHNCSD